MTIFNSTDVLGRAQSLEPFEALVNETFCPLTMDAGAEVRSNFQGRLLRQRLGLVGFAAVKSSPLTVLRTASDIARYSDSSYLVKVQVEGEGLLRHWGREICLQPGDFTICRNSEPYELRFPEQYCQVVLSVPIEMMEECVDMPAQFLGMRMDSSVGANGLFTQFVTSLARQMGTMDGNLAQRLETNVIDLLSTTLCHAHEARRKDLMHDGVKQEYLRRVKQFIRKHLGDESLSPECISSEHNITTRYLHMLFESENITVSRYILRLRLENCRMALTDPTFNDYSACDIGFRFGFKDASHFSRSFKQEFGESPAKFRAAQVLVQG